MFDLMVIDPPWPKKKGNLRAVKPKQTRELDYDTMSTPGIFQLLDKEVFRLAATPHVIFLWTVDEFLQDAEFRMQCRGYNLHARLIWDKGRGPSPSFDIQYAHEYLLWYYRPKMLPVALEARGKYNTVIHAPNREHSRKPDAAYELINNLYPHLSKIDVFSREQRPGWAQWGNQVDYFDRATAVDTAQ